MGGQCPIGVLGVRGGEDARVRRMCAISLGRMKAKEALRTLHKYYFTKKPSQDQVNNACGWAIEQIAGEKMPPAGTITVTPSGWFLSPLGL